VKVKNLQTARDMKISFENGDLNLEKE